MLILLPGSKAWILLISITLDTKYTCCVCMCFQQGCLLIVSFINSCSGIAILIKSCAFSSLTRFNSMQ